MALEGNKDIFNAILKPMKKSPVVTPIVATVVEASEDPVDMPVVPSKSLLAKANSVSKLIFFFPFCPATSVVQNINMMSTSW